MNNISYRMRVFEYADDWICEFPDLPGCSGVGDSAATAVADGEIAKALWLESYMQNHDKAPEASSEYAKVFSGKWVIRVPSSLHRSLALQAEQEGVSLNTLCAVLLAEGLGKRSNLIHASSIQKTYRINENN